MPTQALSSKLDLLHRIEAVAVIAARLLENPRELTANIGKLQESIAGIERKIIDLPEGSQKTALLILPVDIAIAQLDSFIPYASQMSSALFADIMEVRNGLIFIKYKIVEIVNNGEEQSETRI